MSWNASMVLLVGLAGCVLSPELIAQIGNDESGDATETGQPLDLPPPEPSCVGDCPCTGDFCNQSCPADFQPFCDMECPPGASCTQICQSSFCASDCFQGSTCNQQCLTGDCAMDCHGSVECGIDCLGETPCSQICENTDNCHMNCPLGNCTMFCIGSQCTIEQCSGGCMIFCDVDSMCSANCADPTACMIQYF